MPQRCAICRAKRGAKDGEFLGEPRIAAEQIHADDSVGSQSPTAEKVKFRRRQVIEIIARIAECIHNDTVVALGGRCEKLGGVGDMQALPFVKCYAKEARGNRFKRRIDINIINDDVRQVRMKRQ